MLSKFNSSGDILEISNIGIFSWFCTFCVTSLFIISLLFSKFCSVSKSELSYNTGLMKSDVSWMHLSLCDSCILQCCFKSLSAIWIFSIFFPFSIYSRTDIFVENELNSIKSFNIFFSTFIVDFSKHSKNKGTNGVVLLSSCLYISYIK